MFVKNSLLLGKNCRKPQRATFMIHPLHVFDTIYTRKITNHNYCVPYVLFCVCFSTELYTVIQAQFWMGIIVTLLILSVI